MWVPRDDQVLAESKLLCEFSASWVGAAGWGREGCQALPPLFKDQLCRLSTVRSQRTLGSIFLSTFDFQIVVPRIFVKVSFIEV